MSKSKQIHILNIYFMVLLEPSRFIINNKIEDEFLVA